MEDFFLLYFLSLKLVENKKFSFDFSFVLKNFEEFVNVYAGDLFAMQVKFGL